MLKKNLNKIVYFLAGAPKAGKSLKRCSNNCYLANNFSAISFLEWKNFYVDDIIIDEAPVPQPIILSNPTENGMNVHWNQSTALDFYRYRIIISTNQNTVNDFNATPVTQNREETRVFDIFVKTKLDTVLTDLTFTNTLYYAKVYEEDTQNFVNQGSERTDLSTTFNATGEVAPFTQTFESSFNWVADIPWTVTTDDAGNPGHSPTHAYEDSPQGNYPEC